MTLGMAVLPSGPASVVSTLPSYSPHEATHGAQGWSLLTGRLASFGGVARFSL